MWVLISDLEHAGYEAAASCRAEDLDALLVHLKCPLRNGRKWRSADENVKAAASNLAVFGVMVRSRGPQEQKARRWVALRRGLPSTQAVRLLAGDVCRAASCRRWLGESLVDAY